MPIFPKALPLSLYIHIPWCVRKCPYCDFNSHAAKDTLPEDLYVATLLRELQYYLPLIHDRPILSIFFGGGTPSLFSANAIEKILTGITQYLALSDQIEITLEANPGTIDQVRFSDFHQAGINRLSLGIQSLQDEKLKALGRIHDHTQAMHAIHLAKQAGFTNFNIDIMYGLPNQTLEDALHDMQMALSFQPSHFSWYQLTIEPNTLFHHQPPVLPTDNKIWDMQVAGQECLTQYGFKQYEVSAYATTDKECLHNRNYWEFGDYLGLGAGAHSKLTDHQSGLVRRFSQVKNPKNYLQTPHTEKSTQLLSETDLIFEFMLNALRLTQGVPLSLFTERTGLPLNQIEATVTAAKQRGLLIEHPTHLCTTDLGKKFLNDLVLMFLPKNER